MNAKHKKLGFYIMVLLLIFTAVIALILFALKQNINLFFTPTELATTSFSPTKTVRIGGYVKENSVVFNSAGTEVTFVVTDRQTNLVVKFSGLLPNLFREGQSVVITGHVSNSPTLFIATQVLAKHDEKYMPPAIAKQLQKQASQKKETVA